MKENYKKSVKNIVKCLCGLKSKTSVDFRKFPITETFLNKFKISKKYYFDQKINFCESCGHIFLGKQKIGIIGEIDLSITEKSIKKTTFGFSNGI